MSITVMTETTTANEMSPAGTSRRGRPWAESAVWGALWLLSNGETPDWLASHQPPRIRKHLREQRPSGLLWASRGRADVQRFRATTGVIESLKPYLRTSGAGACDLETDDRRLEGYITHARFEWLRDGFPIVPDDAGDLILRVSEFVSFVEGDTMPVAFAAADMACSEDTSQAEQGLLAIDDLLRGFRGEARLWLTVPEMSDAISTELKRGDEMFALRVMANALTESRSLTEPADVVRFLHEPNTTGDQRWNVLIAGAVARECRLRRIEAPTWTNVEGLEPWWFPALIDESLLPLTIRQTPPELSSKGVWLDERALTAV